MATNGVSCGHRAAAAAAASLLLLPLTSGCAHHVLLKAPETEKAAGPGYECLPKTGCTDATVVDPSQQNASGTAFVDLPAQCQGKFHQITIKDADSDEPKVHVLCAAQENVIE